jgi:hypothetical protein
MTAKVLSVFDFVTNLVFAAFKKAMWTVILTAVVASLFTFMIVSLVQAVV